MTRSPLALAALASAAVPGLAPVSVQGVTARAGEQYNVAFLEDQEGRRWVVREPLDTVAAAQLDEAEPLTRLLSRRMPFAIPVAQGYAHLKEGGRAAVYPRLAGEPLDWTQLPAGSQLAAEVGRAIAAVHNVDRALYDEGGVPSYDADTYRGRRLADLDRAAATGHVPTGLLSRWEHALEEVTLWRFATCPVHGNLTDRHVLVAYETDDAGAGTVKALTGWERAQVADPAEDFATAFTDCASAAFDTVLEAYAHARAERPDKHLERRARLAAELRRLTALLEAVAVDDDELVEDRAQALRRLDQDAHESDLLPPAPRFVTAGLPAFPEGPDGGELADLDAPAESASDDERGHESEPFEADPTDQGEQDGQETEPVEGRTAEEVEPAVGAPSAGEAPDEADAEAPSDEKVAAPAGEPSVRSVEFEEQAGGEQEAAGSLEFEAPAGDQHGTESLEFGAAPEAHVPQFAAEEVATGADADPEAEEGSEDQAGPEDHSPETGPLETDDEGPSETTRS